MTTIHLMGTNTCHSSDFLYHLNGEQDWWLIIQTQTPAEFLIDHKFLTYPQNQLVLYPPHSVTTYRACSDTYQNNWIRFYTNDHYIINSNIPAGIPFQAHSPEVFHQLFSMIASEDFLSNTYKEQSIDHLFHLLFYKLMETCNHENVQAQSQNLIDLHFNILSNPSYAWTVAEMADRLHISPGYLQAIYKKSFGVSCMEDVINSRISLAKDYLIHGNYTITQVASLCGYQNTEHFSRQFHKIVGTTPKSYRKQH